jgi:hypothetical protein
MYRSRLLVFVAIALAPSGAWPQGDPLGPEFQINSYTTGLQYGGGVATDASGNFVVVWNSRDQDGSLGGVFGQRYAASGAPLGPEFRVNSYTPTYQHEPSVAADPSGNFVVVWRSGPAVLPGDVFGQRYASDGTPLGPEFRINTFVSGPQHSPDAAADPSGNFVVVWSSVDSSFYGVSGQRFAASGAPLGPEFRVNSYETGYQSVPSVAADAAGNFVVVWSSPGGFAGPGDVFGQRFASNGTPLGPEFRVNTYTTDQQYLPVVAMDATGNFVVIWTGESQNDFGVSGQRFASNGTPLGPEFRVNTYTTGGQWGAGLAADSSGNFVATWSDQGGDVFGQRYSSDGTPNGPEFRINTFAPGLQRGGAVGADPAGNFVAVWTSQTQDGSGYGVFGQRFGRIFPVELLDFGVD